MLAKGQGNNADTYTQPAGVQPTQGDSLNDTLALIQTYMNRIGTDSSYTFLITYDEVSVFTGILDSYPGAAAAYSLRKLDKDYTGYAIKVRESAGNTLADIGFDSNGDLDTTALLAHTGPADGYVQTWYDQSGNGNNASQGTNADQPKIVSSGSVITENGKPAVQFNGAGDLLQNSSVPTGTIFTADAENTIVAVMYQDGSQTSNVLISNNSTTDIFTVWATQGTSNNLIYDVGNSGNNRLLYSYSGATTFEDVQNLLFWSSSATLQQICVNGTQLASGTAPDTITLSSTILRIGSRYSTYLVGSIQELIVYPSDEASNRTDIESNINNHYIIGNIRQPYGGLLGTYKGSAAAYSVRKLHNLAQFAMQIQRASDNELKVIGFDNTGGLDTAAIEDFCSGTTCGVRVWYDQSGNGNDTEQTTFANQPTIYTGGAVVRENGKPAVQFTRTSSQYLENTSDIMTGSNLCTIAVYKGDSPSTENRSIIDQSGGSFGGALFTSASNGYTWFARFSGAYIGGTNALNAKQQRLLFANYVSGASYLAIDGSIASTQAATFSGSGNPDIAFRIGGDSADASRYIDGKVQEVIIYNIDQDSNRTGIEDNINTYYSIYE